MWSLQLEIVSIDNKAECLTDDDWENVGCLQESRNTMLILSRDNLEITISKTALNMLSNLGRVSNINYYFFVWIVNNIVMKLILIGFNGVPCILYYYDDNFFSHTKSYICMGVSKIQFGIT